MPDPIFEHPRLVAIYDALDPHRDDLVAYLALAAEFGARSVLDLGCGTGTLALMLAARGVDVVAVDPAVGSLAVARAKPGAEQVRWVHGTATELPALEVDLVTMTGNAAQAIVDPSEWRSTLCAVHAALRAGGRFVFEVRDPAAQGWTQWTRARSHRVVDIDGVGRVTSWVELTEVAPPLVSFRWTFVFGADGARLHSDSTLRFRGREEVQADLAAAGFGAPEVRAAADRPGLEFVFLASKPGQVVCGR